MLANLTNYVPSEINFVLSDKVKEKYPLTLFDGAKTPEEVIKIVNDKFIALFPENEIASRFYDKHEVNEIREEYCIKQENEVPKRLQEMEETLERIKTVKKKVEEAYNSALMEVRDLAARVKDGTTDVPLSATGTFRLALDGMYLFYSWVDEQFKLAKAAKIPEWDRNSLWAQEDKNRIAMKELFGLDFPEVKRPVNEEEPQQDESDDNLPFGDDDE